MNQQGMLTRYLDSLAGRALSKSYQKTERVILGIFYRFLAKQADLSVHQGAVLAFRAWLARYRTASGQSLAASTIHRYLNSVLNYSTYLYRAGLVHHDPCDGIKVKALTRGQERPIPSMADMATILDSIKNRRDQVLFELLYSTGLRSAEVHTLAITDIKIEERTLLVRLGKGKKDRYVPFGLAVQILLVAYIQKERPRLLRGTEADERQRLFPGLKRSAMVASWKRIVEQAGFSGRGYTLHTIRHACASHLLENGADIRYVQELLGHESLATTQMYTRLSQERIKAVYRSYHPCENEFYREYSPEYRTALDTLVAAIETGRQIRQKRTCAQGKLPIHYTNSVAKG